MPNIDELFAQMRTASVSNKSAFMAPGMYIVDINHVEAKPRRKGGNVFVCEFTIAESDNAAHKPGSTGSWVPKLENDPTWGNMLALAFSALGHEPKHADKDPDLKEQATLLMTAACGGAKAAAKLKEAYGIEDARSILVGRRVKLECSVTQTREKNDFTLYKWSPAPAPTANAA